MDSKLVNMFDLIYCITNTGDLISNEITNHHKKAAYLAFRIAERFGLAKSQQQEIFLAGLLHDVGAFSTSDRLELMEKETPDMHDHAFIGALMLEGFQPLKDAANIIRFHHVPWNGGEGRAFSGRNVPVASHILHLADRIVVLMDPHKDIIGQIKRICDKTSAGSGTLFMPELVGAFLDISRQEYIWLDLTYDPIMTVMPSMMKFDTVELDLDEVIALSEVFAGIIDFRSPFTANHSSGVAAVAEKLAELAGFSKNERKMMLVAGYLHDLGKLAVNNEILEKPDKLDAEEFNAIRGHTFYTYRTLQVIQGFETINVWASYHHEKLNGRGYPFHLSAESIPLGSRIMAVADVFTAITENRPYRKGMEKSQVEGVLKSMVDGEALCPYIFSLLADNLEMLNTVRENAQIKANARYDKIKNIRVHSPDTYGLE
jgi:HD-GYP domain-containing protein (c-di-GMP phosphodiesterase class II)